MIPLPAGVRDSKMRSAAENTAAGKERIWNPLFTMIFIANSCMNLSQQMMNSLIAKYAVHLGAAAIMVGVVSSVYAVTALAFRIVSGPMIDTYNRRFVLAGAMVFMAVSFFGYSVSGNVGTLIGFRLLQGIGQAFTSASCLAMAADTLPKHRFGSGIGVFTMAQAASQAIGPTIALLLVGRVGFQNTYLIGGGIMILAAILAARVKVPYRKTKKLKISLSNIVAKEAILPTVIMFLMALTFFVINSFLIVYAEAENVENIGYYFTVFAVTLLATRPIVGRLTDRFGLIKILIPSMVFFAGSFIMISFSRSLPMFLLAAFVASFGFGASQPAIQTLCMKCVPMERRGSASSTTYIGVDLGSFFGPVIAGALVEAFGYGSMWRLMIIPVLMAMAIAILFRRKIKRTEEEFQRSLEVE